jgi:hypothetical protein
VAAKKSVPAYATLVPVDETKFLEDSVLFVGARRLGNYGDDRT